MCISPKQAARVSASAMWVILWSWVPFVTRCRWFYNAFQVAVLRIFSVQKTFQCDPITLKNVLYQNITNKDTFSSKY